MAGRKSFGQAVRSSREKTKKSPGVPTGAYTPLTTRLDHISVNAGAGTGKTTTGEMAYRVSIRGEAPKFTPSDEQQAIIDAFRGHRRDAAVKFMCFNNSIAQEFENRGLPGSTNHAHGWAAVRRAVRGIQVDRSGFKTTDILCESLPPSERLDAKKDRELVWSLNRLVSLCKCTLTGWRPGMTGADLCDYPEWEDDLDSMIDHFGVDLNGEEARAKALLPAALRLSATTLNRATFDDMIWLPVVNNYPLERYELLIVDERQDLNRCQLELVCRSGDRICGVGDPLQAIYGFAGADAEAFARMDDWMTTNGGRIGLPLMETRRCPVSVVTLANQDAPLLRAHQDNTQGRITSGVPWDALLGDRDWRPTGPSGLLLPPRNFQAGPGDLLLCRLNAPLIQLAYRFMRRDIPAVMLGRDVMEGIQALIRKSNAQDLPSLLSWVENFRSRELDRLERSKYRSESKILAINERCDCLIFLTEGVDSLSDLQARIALLFDERKDRTKCVTLSSIHRAKGLEANRVFIICPEKLPLCHPKQKDWEAVQERHLRYVARTRVRGSKKEGVEGDLILTETPQSSREED